MKTANYHHGDLKRSLISAALEVLESEGEVALSLRRLGKEVGVSQTAIYSHLDNKSALLRELARHGYSELGRCMRTASEGKENARDALFGLAQAYLGFALDHPKLFGLMFSELFSSLHQQDETLFLISTDSYQQMCAAIEAYAEQEGLAFPSQAVTLTIWSTMHGLCHIAIGDRLGQDSLQQLKRGNLLETIFSILISGIQPRQEPLS